jgi:nicotinamidase/pyrazinamidase
MQKILILVDLQKDFLEPDGKLWIGHDTKEYLGNVRTLVKNWQGLIFGLFDAHVENSCEFSQFPPHCIEGTEGQETYEWVTEKLSYPSCRKHGYVSYNLMEYLAENYLKEAEFHFAGVLAHICVQENIAALYNISKETYNVIPKIKVNPLYVDDLTLELKTQALERMKNVYAVEINGEI